MAAACALLACVASAQSVWTGAASTQWNDAANWSTGVVPDVNTDVEIPSGTPNSPATNGGGARAKALVVRSGASISVAPSASDALEIHGDWTVESGATVAGGRVRLLGSGSVSLPPVALASDLEVSATGLVVFASARVHVAGSLALASGTLELSAGNTTEIDGPASFSGGLLRANSGTATLDLDADVTFSGTTADSVLPEIRIAGNWTATTTAFAPGSGSVAFDGTGAQALAGPGLWFHDLLVATGASLSATAGVRVTGALDIAGAYAHASLTGALIVEGDVWVRGPGGSLGLVAGGTARFQRNVRISGGIAAPGTVFFEPVGSSAGLTIDPGSSNSFADVIVSGVDPFRIGAGVLWISGDFTKSTGTLLEFAPGSEVEVAGDARFLGGSIERIGSGAIVDVEGSASFSATSVVTPPALRVGGDFAADGSFTPTSESVRFDGVSPQSVSALGGASALTFSDVEIATGADVTTPVDLSVEVRGAARIDGRLRARGPTGVDGAVNGAAGGELVLEHRLVARAALALEGTLRTTDALAGVGIAPGTGGNDDDDEVVLDVFGELTLGGVCHFGDGIHLARNDVTFGPTASGSATGTGFEVLELGAPGSTTITVRTHGLAVPVLVRVAGGADDAVVVFGAGGDVVSLAAGLELAAGTLRPNIGSSVRVDGRADFLDGVLSSDGAGGPGFDVDGPVRFEGSTDVTNAPDIRCSGDWISNSSFAPGNASVVVFDANGPQVLTQTGGHFRSVVVAASSTTCVASDLVVGAPGTTNGSLEVSGTLGVTGALEVNGTTEVAGTLQATSACPALAGVQGSFTFGSKILVRAAGSLQLGGGLHVFRAGLEARGTVSSTGTIVLAGAGGAGWAGCVSSVRIDAPGAAIAFRDACIGADVEIWNGAVELDAGATVSVYGDFTARAGTALRGAADSALDVGGEAHVLAHVDSAAPGTMTFRGDLFVGPAFRPANGVVVLAAKSTSQLQLAGDAGSARFHELRVEGPGVSPGSDLRLEAVRVTVAAGGVLSTNARRLSIAPASAAMEIEIEGLLHVGAGGVIELASAVQLDVRGPTGVLACIGSAAEPAVVSRPASDVGSGYALRVHDGATLRASHARFERMGAAGVRVAAGAGIGSAPHDLRRVVFDRPAPEASAVLLDIARLAPTELRYVDFRDSGASACDDGGSSARSVRCTSGSTIRFVNWDCAFGPAREDDPGSRVEWSAPETTAVSAFVATGRARAIELTFTTTAEHDVEAFVIERLGPGGPVLATFDVAPAGPSTYTRLDAPLAAGLTLSYRLSERLTHGEVRVLGFASATTTSANVVFVDARATGTADGSSWADAYPTLHAALAGVAGTPVHLWVAAGRYTPTSTLDRAASFALRSGQSIYGGFGGFESSLDQRDPARHRTVLTGDLLDDDDQGLTGENSLHVLRAENADATALLDGVHVEAGRADGTGVDAHGAGLLVLGGSPVIRGTTFRGHAASGSGGAVHVGPGAYAALSACRFVHNTAAQGGAIAVEAGGDAAIVGAGLHGNSASAGGAIALAVGSACTLVNSVLTGNTAATGAGIDAGAGANFVVQNSTLAGNAASAAGGGLHAPLAVWSLENSIVHQNSAAGASGLAAQLGPDLSGGAVQASCVEGFLAGTGGNLSLDPRFLDLEGQDEVVGTPDDDVRLAHDSPALDAADPLLVPADVLDVDHDGNSAETLPLDRAGRPRAAGAEARPDMGAYERALDCDGDGTPDQSALVDCNGNAHPDACDIADGIAEDRDLDARPDACATGVPYCSGDGSASACPCGNAGSPGAGCANSLGTSARLAAHGAASLANDGLELSATGMPNGTALYFQGTQRTNGGAGESFGDGLRCAGGTVLRLAVRTNVLGSSGLGWSTGSSVSLLGLVAAPGTRTYQVWYRNAAVYCTAAPFNLTNGVELEWRP